MDHQKIDRLFREKLDSYEVMPSNEAWAKVEKQIGSKQTTNWYYWVAASVTLLIISWVVWPKESGLDLTPIASDINHPVIQQSPDWNLPNVVAQEETNTTSKAPQVKPVIQPKKVDFVANNVKKPSIDEELLNEAPKVEFEAENAVAELEKQDVEEMKSESPVEELPKDEAPAESIKVDLSKVKITYIAANDQDKKQPSDSVKGVKKLFALAGKLSPGDVLADIKTAKDDLINGGFKSKKDRTSL